MIADERASLVVHAPEELDSTSAAPFRDELALALGHVPWIVVDMTTTAFIDSSGMGALVAAHKMATARGGALSVRGANERVLATLRIAGLAVLFGAEPPPS